MRGRPLSHRGFTLVELLVTALIGGMVAVGTLSFFGTLNSAFAMRGYRERASAELQELINDIEKQFRERVPGTPPNNTPTYKGVASAAFPAPVPGPPSPCQDLQITQLDPSSGLVRTVVYSTRCVSIKGTPGFALPRQGNSALICDPGDRAAVVVTKTRAGVTTTTNYPKPGNTLTTALCFRLQGQEVAVEAGSAYGSVKANGVASSFIGLSNQGQAPGIVYFSP